MPDERPHPLLAQVPLTVSPFVSLPTATTLPYTYKPLPSTLPPSSTTTSSATSSTTNQPYIHSTTGHASHHTDILSACQSLQSHLASQRRDADKVLAEWLDGIKERELAEKRRVAPGWLDREEKMLMPKRRGGEVVVEREGLGDTGKEAAEGGEGWELDRAFGGMGV